MKDVLINLGFTNNEVDIYLVLLKQGAMSAGRVAAKSGIHRRSVYDGLERLCSKGVVGYIKENNVKVYSVTNPEELLDVVRRKEEEVKSVLPELLEIYGRTKSRKETVFFKGKEGIRHIFEDQIAEGDDVLVMGGSSKVYDVLKFYIPHYERERLRVGINTKMIVDSKDVFNVENAEIRVVEHSLGPTAVNIYGNKVALIVWSSNPYAILIDDEDVAMSYRLHFDIIWKTSKIVKE